jgi:hypothetical protein
MDAVEPMEQFISPDTLTIKPANNVTLNDCAQRIRLEEIPDTSRRGERNVNSIDANVGTGNEEAQFYQFSQHTSQLPTSMCVKGVDDTRREDNDVLEVGLKILRERPTARVMTLFNSGTITKACIMWCHIYMIEGKDAKKAGPILSMKRKEAEQPKTHHKKFPITA